jgi:cell division septation protein DedD
MATDKRTPEDLQEAVAATLRRLRGEGAAQPNAAERTEPQLSSAPSITVTGATPKVAPSNSATGSASASPSGPGTNLDADVEPDLLSVANLAPDDAASPGSRASVLKQARAAFAPEPEMSQPPLLRYVVALAAVLVLGGVAWWAYHAFIGRPKNGEVPMIAADQTPEKVPPSDQTASAAPDQDKTIYNQISPGSVPASKGEVLLPQPELPQAPPAPPSPAPSATELTGGFVTDPAVPSQGSGQSSTDQSTAAGQTTSNQAGSAATLGPAPADPAPAPTDTTGAPDNATLAPAAPPPPPPAPGAAAKADAGRAADGGSAASSSGASKPAAQPPAKTQTAIASGNYRIQLAALKSESAARTAWKRLLAKHKGVLGPLSLQVQRADLGSQGIYYRVEAGPFAEKSAAKAACTKLKAQGQQCLVKP